MATALMLRAPSDILSKAQDELALRGYNPLQLASELSLSVQLIENFLNGEIVDRNTYSLICEKLNITINSVQELSAENSVENKVNTNLQAHINAIKSNNITLNANSNSKDNSIIENTNHQRSS